LSSIVIKATYYVAFFVSYTFISYAVVALHVMYMGELFFAINKEGCNFQTAERLMGDMLIILVV